MLRRVYCSPNGASHFSSLGYRHECSPGRVSRGVASHWPTSIQQAWLELVADDDDASGAGEGNQMFPRQSVYLRRWESTWKWNRVKNHCVLSPWTQLCLLLHHPRGRGEYSRGAPRGVGKASTLSVGECNSSCQWERKRDRLECPLRGHFPCVDVRSASLDSIRRILWRYLQSDLESVWDRLKFASPATADSFIGCGASENQLKLEYKVRRIDLAHTRTQTIIPETSYRRFNPRLHWEKNSYNCICIKK